MKKAVFLDRDGTINKDVGYPSKVEQISIFPEAVEAVKKLNKAGFKIFVITNQSGVARKIIKEDELGRIHAFIDGSFRKEGAVIDGIYYCPHHPDFGDAPYRMTCGCRKPLPGMILQAGKEHDIDLKGSFMVGDKSSDVEAGRGAGCTTVYLRNPKFPAGKGMKADLIANDLSEAAEWILKRESK